MVGTKGDTYLKANKPRALGGPIFHSGFQAWELRDSKLQNRNVACGMNSPVCPERERERIVGGFAVSQKFPFLGDRLGASGISRPK